jgi:hypothetical protein
MRMDAGTFIEASFSFLFAWLAFNPVAKDTILVAL